MNCGDATKTQVDNAILADIPRGTKREIKMLVGCAICQHTQFLLLVPETEGNIIDDMLEGIEL
jgi:hypothetical protein